MEHKSNVVSSDKNWSPKSSDTKNQNLWSSPLAWWYHLVAPPEPLISAKFSQRENVRHGKLAAIAMPIFMLFLLTVVMQQAIISHDPVLTLLLFMGLMGSFLILLLNRKGFVKLAGVLALSLLYVGETISLLRFSGGLTMSSIYTLDFTIIPDLLVLAFFSANSLALIVGLNFLQVLVVLVYGPHDATVAHLLHTAPLEIFFHIYILQLITAIVLYLWARSTENALIRADRAEEIIAFERRERAQQDLELEQKRQLDAGIQEILQTHIAVANGDLSVRAPLHQDHVLWQVAASLNNLIARLQSLSLSEREHRQHMQREDERKNNTRKFEQTQTSIPVLPKGDERIADNYHNARQTRTSIPIPKVNNVKKRT
jgi:hypothetical protein